MPCPWHHPCRPRVLHCNNKIIPNPDSSSFPNSSNTSVTLSCSNSHDDIESTPIGSVAPLTSFSARPFCDDIQLIHSLPSVDVPQDFRSKWFRSSFAPVIRLCSCRQFPVYVDMVPICHYCLPCVQNRYFKEKHIPGKTFATFFGKRVVVECKTYYVPIKT